MAIKKVIQIDVEASQGQAQLQNLDNSVQKAEGSAKSLRTQLREAQMDVAMLSEKFGATSREAVEAAKKAALLKDQIGDAKTLTDAYNPDAKFNALGGALQGVAGGFSAVQGALGTLGIESENTEKMILKVNSAMALSSGLNSLLESRESFKTLGKQAADAFKAIRTGIGSTGIGLLVIALGTIVMYWDDIKEAVSGVSEEQKDNLATMEEASSVSQKQLDATLANEETLKRQGKTEEEIYQIKLKAYQKAIKDKKNEIIAEQKLNNARVEATERNFKMVKKFMDITLEFGFSGLRAIAGIVDLIIGGVNSVSKLIGKGNIINFSANEFLTNARNQLSSFAASKVFDVNGLKEEIKKSNEEDQKALDKLINDESALINRRKDGLNKGKKGEKEAKPKKEEKTEEEKQAEENAKRIKEINEKLAKDLEDLQAKTDQQKLDLQKKREEEELNSIKASGEDKKKIQEGIEQARLLLAQKYAKLQNEIDEKARKEREEKEFQNEMEMQSNIANNQNESFKARLFALQEQERLITENKNLSEKEQTDALDANIKARIKLAEEEKAGKLAAAEATAQTLSALSELLGKETAAGKAAAVASATISTFLSAQKAYDSTVGIPIVGPVLAPINAALAIASGIKSVKNILAVKTPNGGGGSGSSINPSVAGASAPRPSFNLVGNAGVNQIAQNIAQQGSQPIKAYVVSKDVTTAQELDRNKVRATRI